MLPIMCSTFPSLCFIRYSTLMLSPGFFNVLIRSVSISLSTSITEHATMSKPSFSRASADSYPSILSAALFMLSICEPSSEWHKTPQSIVVNIFSSERFLRTISFSKARSLVISIATPTVPITLPSKS